MSAVSHKDRDTYFSHIEEASKPMRDRRNVVTGREGRLPPRRHHLMPEQQEKLLKEIDGNGYFISPFKRFGAYDGLVSALIALGENESHSLKSILNAFKGYMSSEDSRDKSGQTAWDRFVNKKPRSAKTGLDYTGRIRQNVAVLQRMGGEHPYALKLAQLGAAIDIMKGSNGEFRVRLRTGIPYGEKIIPFNEMKTRDCPKSVNHLISRMRYGISESGKKSGKV